MATNITTANDAWANMDPSVKSFLCVAITAVAALIEVTSTMVLVSMRTLRFMATVMQTMPMVPKIMCCPVSCGYMPVPFRSDSWIKK